MIRHASCLVPLAAAALLLVPFEAAAGVLAPGEGIRSGDAFLLDPNDPSFAGETLFSAIALFDIVFVQPEGGNDSVRGTFTHSVVRESATGHLAFHYTVQQTERVGRVIDFDDFYVRGFAGFTTDVYRDQRALVVGAAERSADGDTIHFLGSEEPFSGTFVVRTNATDFRPPGAIASVLARAQGGDPFGGSDRLVTLDGTAVPVPEPTVALAALLGVGASTMFTRRRRR
jgi:hypothetical protein